MIPMPIFLPTSGVNLVPAVDRLIVAVGEWKARAMAAENELAQIKELKIPPESDPDFYSGWEFPFATALGYTFQWADSQAPTAWRLVPHPFSFLVDTNEVLIEEVDGHEDAKGIRQSQLDPANKNKILTTARRVNMPIGWEIVRMLSGDNTTHVIALPNATA